MQSHASSRIQDAVSRSKDAVSRFVPPPNNAVSRLFKMQSHASKMQRNSSHFCRAECHTEKRTRRYSSHFCRAECHTEKERDDILPIVAERSVIRKTNETIFFPVLQSGVSSEKRTRRYSSHFCRAECHPKNERDDILPIIAERSVIRKTNETIFFPLLQSGVSSDKRTRPSSAHFCRAECRTEKRTRPSSPHFFRAERHTEKERDHRLFRNENAIPNFDEDRAMDLFPLEKRPYWCREKLTEKNPPPPLTKKKGRVPQLDVVLFFFHPLARWLFLCGGGRGDQNSVNFSRHQ